MLNSAIFKENMKISFLHQDTQRERERNTVFIEAARPKNEIEIIFLDTIGGTEKRYAHCKITQI